MLNLFADALLIATRLDHLGQPERRHHPEPEAELKAKRRWFSLTGLRL